VLEEEWDAAVTACEGINLKLEEGTLEKDIP